MMPDKKAPVTLENLLRLKRAERPDPEFWSRFESELRAKQLAAIVAKRPWWNGMSRIFALVARNHLPIGAVAVLALTWVGVRQFESPWAVGPATANRDNGRIAAAVASQAALPVPESRIVSVDEDTVAAPDEVRAAAPVIPANTPHIVEMAATHALPANSNSTDAAGNAGEAKMMPVNQSLNIDMTAMQANEPDLSRRFMGMTQGFAASEISARQPMTDPLARMNPASDERRSRLLATALPAVASTMGAPVASSERMVTHLSEDRFYESISRYSGGGDRFSIKF